MQTVKVRAVPVKMMNGSLMWNLKHPSVPLPWLVRFPHDGAVRVLQDSLEVRNAPLRSD